MTNLLIAQSGGPSAAINATMLGIIQRAVTSGEIDKIYGALHGVKGLLEENIKEIGPLFEDPLNMVLLSNTPSSALGSCRYKLSDDPETYAKVISILRKFGVGYFIYIGGNDSMDTVWKLSRYCEEQNIDIKVMGAPKTIDNDLCVTDHTPGFGSAAKYIATTISEIFCDIRVYDIPTVTIVEIMGRHAGWLAASSCLAGLNGHEAPHFIYIPEIPFDEKRFVENVREKAKETPYVLIVVSEGAMDINGVYLCEKDDEEKSSDAFGHKFLSGSGKYLERVVSRELGFKVRTVELSLMQRSAAHLASSSDLEEARMLGAAALDRALAGGSGEMSVIKRISTHPYRFKIETTPIENVANHEKLVPLEWMNEKGDNVNQEMVDYLYPLIQGECHIRYKNGIPEHIRIY